MSDNFWLSVVLILLAVIVPIISDLFDKFILKRKIKIKNKDMDISHPKLNKSIDKSKKNLREIIEEKFGMKPQKVHI